jgi:RND family efflux transporter MFP subunit
MRAVSALCCLAAVLFGLSHSIAHEGHDHGDGASALAASAYPRVSAQSELYEIVGILKGDRLTIYLDHFATNEPVNGATVKVTIGDAEPVDATPAGPGLYAIALPRPAAAGSIELVFNIAAAAGDDLLIGALAPPRAAGTKAAPAAGGTSAHWIASIPQPVRNPLLLAIVTVGLGLSVRALYRRGHIVSATASGAAAGLVLVVLVAVASSRDEPPRAEAGAAAMAMSDAPRRLADGASFVAKPTQRLLEVRTVAAKPETVRPAVKLIGRVIGDPNRTSVVQSVHGGRVIPLDGGLPRIGQAVRKGDVLAQIDPYLPLADRTTIMEKSREIEQLIAVAETKIRRLRPLAERGAVPLSQVTDLETELEGLRQRREAIRNTRTELELLRATTDGVIAAAKVVPGQVVQAQDLLFQIVDPNGFWVEALAYGDVDPDALSEATAVATSGQPMALDYRGFSRTLQQHASVVHFAVSQPPANLSIGQPVTVVAKTGAPTTALVVQRDAVVRSANGEAVVWLRAEPERFEPRPVRTQPFDATRLIIAAGVAEGERVVTRAADLINQIR